MPSVAAPCSDSDSPPGTAPAAIQSLIHFVLEHRADIHLVGDHEGHGFALEILERIGFPRDVAPGNLGVLGRDFDRIAREVVRQLRRVGRGIADDPDPEAVIRRWLEPRLVAA